MTKNIAGSQNGDLIRSANALFRQQRFADAWEQINIALNAEPDSPEPLYLAGCIARSMGNMGVALALLRRCLAFEREQANVWMHYGATLHDLHRYVEAREVFHLVHARLPHDPMPIANISSTYIQEGNAKEADAWADRALAINPQSIIARISKGFAAMSLGNWPVGWQNIEYLYENHLEARVYNPPEEEEPVWDGSPGKTVVVQCDQGVGDQIMFAQILPEVIRDSKKVIVECAQRMVTLFRRSFPGADYYGTIGYQNLAWPRKYKIDSRVHISYLGRFYRQKDSDFPRRPYLVPDPELQEKWRRWLAHMPRPWVGIAWIGGLIATNKAKRSVTLEDFAPILANRGTFVDMSYTDERGTVARWNIGHERQVICPPIDQTEFDDTVALVSVLDHVVTVTTTLAHVCGALGHRASVLVPVNAQWRYQYRCGDGMIWYPENSVSLYRQQDDEEDLSGAIRRVAKDFARSRALRAA